ncbi:MAG: hypothetical protein AB8B92_11765 [Gammaproteobacteria bacterium]
MQAAEEALLSFFNQVALKNPAVLVTLNSEECFDINTERWKFKLPDLHLFLQQQESAFAHIDYNSFRKILFNCPINQNVKSNGSRIIITENHNNVDKTQYTLIWG